LTQGLAIEAKGLIKAFDGKPAVQGIDIAVPEGSIYGILGPNGAGKTTTLRMLLGIIDPDEGRRTLLGRERPIEAAGEVGYLPEERGLYQAMKTRDAIAFMGALRGLPLRIGRERAEALLRENRLGDYVDKPIKSLSKGMAQTVQLLGTIVHRPKLIVLDEPFSGLDVLVREQLIESIVERTPEATVLLASHDLAEIESFATHIGYLNEGRLEFVEELSSLFDRFREIEVVADADPRGGAPPEWLNVERSPHVVRFTDTRFAGAAAVAERFPGASDIAARPMSLRQIVIALAKASRRAA
jgi:ABC-2 type transport system ATP-binding protein